jgi:uncharacterized protein (DUF362 family)
MKRIEMTRREFFAAGGGVVGALSSKAAGFASRAGHGILQIPAGPQAPPGSQTKTLPQIKGSVILVRTQDRTAGVKKCLEILKTNPFQGKNVLIKPNFNTSDPTPGSTHNDTLRAILANVKEMGGKDITIGDRSGPEPTEQVLQKKGIFDLAAEFDAKVVNFDELGDSGYVKVSIPRMHWQDGFLIAGAVAKAECIVSTCCLKTHQYGGVITMSLKNSVGVVPGKGYPYMRELHSSPAQRKMIAEINIAYKPAVVILDGLEAFVDGGPMKGTKKAANVFLAGTDRVAIDAVGTAILKDLKSNDDIMKPRVYEQEQIARAAELGLGATSGADITIETGDKLSAAYAERVRRLLVS